MKTQPVICFKRPGVKISNFPLFLYIEHLEIIEPQSNIQICRDPDDDKFINWRQRLVVIL
jgi:predicted nucleic acid-binding protein